MKTFLISATAIAGVLAVAPALAQTAPVAPAAHPMQMHAMTRAEVTQKVQQHFAKLDANKDGFVTKEEVDSAHEQMRSKIITRVEQRMGDHDGAMPDRGAMFDRLDANHDGSISREEFMAAKPMVQERRVVVMNGGPDGDGHAMGMGMHRMGMHGGMFGRMFATADANKDGRVSLQEATNAALAHFDAADTNHDGTITPDEMRAAHKAMGARPGRR